MKQKTKKNLALLTALLFSAALTACGSNTTDDLESSDTTAALTSVSIGSESYAESSIQTEAEKTAESVSETLTPIIFDPKKHIEIFSSELKADGEAYEVRAFAYDHIEKSDENTVMGDLAIELRKNSEWINTLIPPFVYMSQNTNIYSGDDFEVTKLDGGEVFSAYCFSAGNSENEIGITSFFRVINGKLEYMQRFYTEEEKKQIKLDEPHSHTDSEWLCFHTAGSFTRNKNTLTFTLDKDMTKNETVYPAGEITLKFDFENNTVRCDREEYQDLVYHY